MKFAALEYEDQMTPRHQPIVDRVIEALDNEVANEHLHQVAKSPSDYVDEIHDFSGIEGYSPDNPEHRAAAIRGVYLWRAKNGY